MNLVRRSVLVACLLAVHSTGGGCHSSGDPATAESGHLLLPARALRSGPGRATPRFVLIDLGPLPGHSASSARAVNNHGVVTGYSTDVVGWDRIETVAGGRAVAWQDLDGNDVIDAGERRNLGTLRVSGAGESWAFDLNDSGVIVGRASSDVPASFGQALLQGFCFPPEEEVMQVLLGVDLQYRERAPTGHGVNNLAPPQIVGERNDRAGFAPDPPPYQALFWLNPESAPVRLKCEDVIHSGFGAAGRWAWTEGVSLAINDSSVIVGWWNLQHDGVPRRFRRAVRWVNRGSLSSSDDRKAQDLRVLAAEDFYVDGWGIPLAYEAEALDVNNAGHAVGWSETDRPGRVRRAFLWRDLDGNDAPDLGEMTDLGALTGQPNVDASQAQAINDHDEVVGHAFVDGQLHAFLWSDGDGLGSGLPGRMIDLNSVPGVQGKGWVLRQAWDINDLGWVVGFGTAPDGSTRGYLLRRLP